MKTENTEDIKEYVSIDEALEDAACGTDLGHRVNISTPSDGNMYTHTCHDSRTCPYKEIDKETMYCLFDHQTEGLQRNIEPIEMIATIATKDEKKALWKDIGHEVKWSLAEIGIAYAGVGMAIADTGYSRPVGMMTIGIAVLGALSNACSKWDALERWREFQHDPKGYVQKYHS
ncbi:MAG: hypothetical protein V1729_02900 [Candidatus Woesearchaeota archaeon]